MTTPNPGVYISPPQMYQEVRDLARTVDRIEAKVDAFLNEAESIRGDVSDHETRIRTLETMVRWAAGVAAVLGAGLGVLVQYLLR